MLCLHRQRVSVIPGPIRCPPLPLPPSTPPLTTAMWRTVTTSPTMKMRRLRGIGWTSRLPLCWVPCRRARRSNQESQETEMYYVYLQNTHRFTIPVTQCLNGWRLITIIFQEIHLRRRSYSRCDEITHFHCRYLLCFHVAEDNPKWQKVCKMPPPQKKSWKWYPSSDADALQNLVSCCDTQSNGGVPHGSILGPLIDLIHASLVTVWCYLLLFFKCHAVLYSDVIRSFLHAN